MFIGSVTCEVKGLDSTTHNSEGKATCSTIESAAVKAQEKMRMEEEAQDVDQQDQDSQNN